MNQSHFHGYVYHDKKSIHTAAYVSKVFKTKEEAEKAARADKSIARATVSPLMTYGGSYNER